MTATRVVHTACTLDCPDACALTVTVAVEGGVERIVKVDAAPGDPITDGWICAKVRRSAERVYSPDRVLTPLIRVGPKGDGAFRSATWSEALDLVADRMRAARAVGGGDAIVAYTYNSSSARLEKKSASEALFAALGATVADHTICAHTVSEAWASVYGSMGSANPADVVHSDYVVLWGANPNASNVHVAELLRQAQRAGTRVVVIDPRATPVAQRAHLHLAVRPGTDVVLAYAIARHWHHTGAIDHDFLAAHHVQGVDTFLAAADRYTLDEAAAICGVPAAHIEQLADEWASSKRAMLRLGWGAERNRNGFSSCRAVLALPALGGHFPRSADERGRGVAQALSVPAGLIPASRWPVDAFPVDERRHVPMHQIGTWLAPDAGDPCRLLFVQGANPMVMCPDAVAVRTALQRDDIFTVVHEQVLTDTARYADVVLPATTSFEIDDVAHSYGATTVLPVRAAIAPVGESWSNDQVGVALAASMGLEWQLPPVSAGLGERASRREAYTAVVHTLQFVDTVDRVYLAEPPHGAPTFTPPDDGLAVLSPSSTKMINSIFGEFQNQPADVQVHPLDAERAGANDGDLVELYSSTTGATIRVPIRVTTDVREGVAVMPKGVWLRHHHDGLGVNALTPATGDPTTNGACFNDARVTLRRPR